MRGANGRLVPRQGGEKVSRRSLSRRRPVTESRYRRDGMIVRYRTPRVKHKKRAASAASILVRQHAPPEALGAPDAGAQALQLDDLAVVHEQVDLRAVALDVPGEHLRVGGLEHDP